MSILYDLDELAYHARPELSSTGARSLLHAAALFKFERDNPKAGKRAFDIGHAAHAKILGVGLEVVEYPAEHITPSGNVSTKAATLAWAETVRAAGKVPVSPDDMRKVEGMSEAVLAEPAARAVLESAASEVSIIAEVNGVPIRARFDLLGERRGGDLKTARDASPAGFNRAVHQRGYHIQQAWYDDAYEAVTGHRLESAFKFIVVESHAPYLVGVWDLDPMWREAGAIKAAEARDIYKRCMDSGAWPGYGAGTLIAPTYAVYEGEDTEVSI